VTEVRWLRAVAPSYGLAAGEMVTRSTLAMAMAMVPLMRPKQKAARRRLQNSNPMIVDQAAINAGLAFRR
jgi:hypothetical protein